MLDMRLSRFWRYTQALRHALIRIAAANELQNDVLTRAEVHIVHPRARVFFAYLRDADGFGDVRIHCLQSPKLHVPPIRAASSFGSTGHGPTGVTPLMNEFIAAHPDLTDTPCHVRTLIDTVAPSA